ncbi:HepT-like ribonuclease domain-containing protein [Pseudonocardia kujensis]
MSWLTAAWMRDRLIHHYLDIDLHILWTTVTNDLPRLLQALPTPPKDTQ